MNTQDYLQKLSIALGKDGSPATDYRIAKTLAVSTQFISQCQKGSATFGEKTTLKAAEILGISKDKALAWWLIERTKCPEAEAIYKRWLKQMGRAAVAVLTLGTMAYVTVGMSYSPSADASEGSVRGANTYYVKYSLAMLDLVPASAPPRQALAELQDAAHCATFAVRVLDELREQANSRRLQKREYGRTAPVKTAT